MRTFFIGIIVVVVFLFVTQSSEITHYPPNPNMNIQIVSPNHVRNIDGTYTHVYIKGNRVSIVNDEVVNEFPLDEVVITFDKSKDSTPSTQNNPLI